MHSQRSESPSNNINLSLQRHSRLFTLRKGVDGEEFREMVKNTGAITIFYYEIAGLLSSFSEHNLSEQQTETINVYISEHIAARGMRKT